MDELENGTRPSTPAGDNVLRDFALAESAAYAAVTRAAGGRVEHVDELGLTMTDAGSACPFGNVAELSQPVSSGDAERLVDALGTFYGAAAGGPYIVFSSFPTPDLAAHGMHLGGHPPMMVRPAGPAPVDTSGLRIEVVSGTASLEDFERTITEAFPMNELMPFGSCPRLFADAVIDTDWTFYVGYDGDRPVATAAAYVTDELVAVEMVSTRDECRGRGFGAAITAASAATRTDRPSALVSSDLGRGVYQRLGFMPILRYTLWVGER